MAMQLSRASGGARSEPPRWTVLVLEMVALPVHVWTQPRAQGFCSD
jgi:hypothetical protein